MHGFSSPRQADVPAFGVSAVRQHDDLVDRTALACVRGDAHALIDARPVPPHSPAVIQDEFGIGDFRTCATSLFLNTFFPSLNPAVTRIWSPTLTCIVEETSTSHLPLADGLN